MDPRGTTSSPTDCPTEETTKADPNTSKEAEGARAKIKDGPRLYVLPLPKFKVFVFSTVQRQKKKMFIFLPFLPLEYALSSSNFHLSLLNSTSPRLGVAVAITEARGNSYIARIGKIPGAQIHSIHSQLP